MGKPTRVLLAFAMVVSMMAVSVVPAGAVPTTRYVATTGTDTGDCSVNACLTIQYAIGQAGPGDTINVAAGTYTETGQIVIDKDLSIVGASAATTTIKPAGDTGSSGDARGWFVVNDGKTFNLSNVTLDGTGRKVYQAIRHKGRGTIADCVFTEIKYEPGSAYSGMAVAVMGNGNVDITNCSFSQIGRIGVIFFGTGVTGSVFSGNTYVGKGVGNWLDYGVEVGGGAKATISGNTISNCLGVAVDGSTSGGILVTTYYGLGTTATITGNTITNCTEGIAVGYLQNDSSVVVAHYNNFSGNATGVGTTGVAVDAENNWWGAPSGPTHSGNPGGQGDAVYGNVDYDPWLGWPEPPAALMLWVEEPEGPFIPGDVVSVVIRMRTPGSVFGGQFTLEYDTSELTLGGVTAGPHFPTKWVDTSQAGKVIAAFENLGQSFAGTDALAHINFTVIATADLDLSAGRFSLIPDSNPFDLPDAGLGDGVVTVSAPGVVSGKVILQGRDYLGHATRNGGATVILSVAGGTTTSAPGGGFSFSSVRPGSYEAQARMDGYLTAVKPGINVVSGSNDIGTVKLLGGDATRDQMINIQDLAFIGSRFNKTTWVNNDSWADINGDGKIDILDLTLAGSNFGKAAPQAWKT